MKYALITIALFTLAACVEEGQDVTSDMTSICIDGVEYWYRGMGSSQMMAPRIDPETLTFVRCDK